MFKNQGLQARLLTAFLAVGAIVLIVALIGWFSTARLSGHIKNVGDNAFPSVVNLWKANEAQSRVQASQKALIITSTPLDQRQKELAKIQSALKDVDDGFNEYAKTFRYPEEDQIYKRVQTEWSKWRAASDQLLQLHAQFLQIGVINPRKIQLDLLAGGRGDAPEFAAARAASDALTKMSDYAQTTLDPVFESSTNVLGELLTFNSNVAETSKKSAYGDAATSTFLILVCLIVGPATALGFGLYFSNAIIKPLGAKIAGVVGVIAASGKQLEATMTEQVASTNEVAATSKEIATTSRNLTKTMEQVEQASKVTADSAGQSQKDLSHMETTMRKLADATGSISAKLGTISEKANNINTIITTITKVADQTNLLSLNAAIEAEKAGEYGTGFAVVAREIRRLADQTAVATLDIENMVKEMQSAVSTGVMEMDKFTKEVEQGVDDVQNIGMKLESIIDQVQNLTPRFEEVSNSMEGQSQGASQISEAMGQLTEASSQSTLSLRDINSAISQLNETLRALKLEVSRFQVNRSYG